VADISQQLAQLAVAQQQLVMWRRLPKSSTPFTAHRPSPNAPALTDPPNLNPTADA